MRNVDYEAASAIKEEASSYSKIRYRTVHYPLTPRFFGKLRMTSYKCLCKERALGE